MKEKRCYLVRIGRAFRVYFEFREQWVRAGKKEGPREVEIKAMQSACSTAGTFKDAYVPELVCRGLRLEAWFWIDVIPEHWHRSRMEEHEGGQVQRDTSEMVPKRKVLSVPLALLPSIVLSPIRTHPILLIHTKAG